MISSNRPDRGWRRRPRFRSAATVALLTVLNLSACAGDRNGVPGADGDEPLVPALRPVPAEPEIVADLFPATGSRGLVLNHCSSCHSPACAVISQRNRAEWLAVEASHIEYGEGLSSEDRGKIFEYLNRHFNDTLPEPAVPGRFLEGGCGEGVLSAIRYPLSAIRY